MKHIKTFEGIFSFFKKKEKEKEIDIVTNGNNFYGAANLRSSANDPVYENLIREYVDRVMDSNKPEDRQVDFTDRQQEYLKSLSNTTEYRRKKTRANPTQYGATFYYIEYELVTYQVIKMLDEWYYIYSQVKLPNDRYWGYKDYIIKCDQWDGVTEFFEKNPTLRNNILK
jgi:hypothetical protein